MAGATSSCPEHDYSYVLNLFTNHETSSSLFLLLLNPLFTSHGAVLCSRTSGCRPPTPRRISARRLGPCWPHSVVTSMARSPWWTVHLHPSHRKPNQWPHRPRGSSILHRRRLTRWRETWRTRSPLRNRWEIGALCWRPSVLAKVDNW